MRGSSDILRRELAARTTTAKGARNDSLAYKMLAYPAAYVVLVMPLAIFRLVELSSHHSSANVQVAVGCLFTLSGRKPCRVALNYAHFLLVVNVCLYTFTRNLFKYHSTKAPESRCALIAAFCRRRSLCTRCLSHH
jgi:hypothetical protein